MTKADQELAVKIALLGKYQSEDQMATTLLAVVGALAIAINPTNYFFWTIFEKINITST